MKTATAHATSELSRILNKHFLAVLVAIVVMSLSGCNRAGSPVSPVVPLSRVNTENYDKIGTGMTKSQVETILGPPTSAETKDMVIFKKTTYRYEDGEKFIVLTFKNEELDSKDGNVAVAR
jgi:SmpA / OmlA family